MSWPQRDDMESMMKHNDYVVQEKSKEFDRDCLHRKLFAVNMRLYQTSPQYQALVRGIVAYMSWFLDQTWEDYDQCSSISGANLGIPFNVIVFKAMGEKKVMLNPEIIEGSDLKVTGWTNNGSLRLKAKISVQRHDWINVRYYDLDGNLCFEEKMDRSKGGLAVQHEVDSNNGITIEDRHAMQKPYTAEYYD